MESTQNQELATFDPVGYFCTQQTQFRPTTTAPLLNASSLTQVGYGLWSNTDVWPVGYLCTNPTPNTNQYVTFTLIPYERTVQYTTLTYSKVSYSGFGARAASVRSSEDNYQADIDTVIGISPHAREEVTFDISSIRTCRDVTFRIYWFDAPGDGEDWADLDSSNNGGCGLIVRGHIVNDTPNRKLARCSDQTTQSSMKVEHKNTRNDVAAS